jgi:hypothetical protein
MHDLSFMRKNRHAALLALVGWYLLVAPITNGAARCPPISDWKLRQSFDTTAACERALKELRRPRMEEAKEGHGAWDNCGSATDWGSCIACDDPRLQAK